jgi:hypothetical protein
MISDHVGAHAHSDVAVVAGSDFFHFLSKGREHNVQNLISLLLSYTQAAILYDLRLSWQLRLFHFQVSGIFLLVGKFHV